MGIRHAFREHACTCGSAQESSSIAKRKAEEVEAASARRAHKRLKQELRTRGHMKVPRKGEDPAHDVREKGLMRLANRCVCVLHLQGSGLLYAAVERDMLHVHVPGGNATGCVRGIVSACPL